MDDYYIRNKNHPNVDGFLMTIFIHFWILTIPAGSPTLMLAAIRHFVRLSIAITLTKLQLSIYTHLLASFPGPAQLSIVRARGGTGNEAMQLQFILLP